MTLLARKVQRRCATLQRFIDAGLLPTRALIFEDEHCAIEAINVARSEEGRRPWGHVSMNLDAGNVEVVDAGFEQHFDDFDVRSIRS